MKPCEDIAGLCVCGVRDFAPRPRLRRGPKVRSKACKNAWKPVPMRLLTLSSIAAQAHEGQQFLSSRSPIPKLNPLATATRGFRSKRVTLNMRVMLRRSPYDPSSSLAELYEALLGSGKPVPDISGFLYSNLLSEDIPLEYQVLTKVFWSRIPASRPRRPARARGSRGLQRLILHPAKF